MFERKKILVTQEIVERVVLRRSAQNAVREFCESCGREVSFLRTEEAVEISRQSAREICRLTDAGKIHFGETERGHLLVCADSLVEYLQKGVL